MLLESPVLETQSQNSPRKLHSPLRNSSPSSQLKGKGAMYSEDPQPVGYPEGPSDSPRRPSLLERLQSSPPRPLSERISPAQDTRIPPERVTSGPPHTSNELESGEGEDLLVAVKNLQDTPQAHDNSNGIRVKAEETVPAISSPTKTTPRTGRARGSRPSIDVFTGAPVDQLESELSEPSTSLLKHEHNTDRPEGTSVDKSKTDSVPAPNGFTPDTTGQEHPLFTSPPPISSRSSVSLQSFHSDQESATTIIATDDTGDLGPALPPASSMNLPPAVLDQCRKLMIPLIDRNARLRNPDIDEAVVKQRALSLLSDDLCSELVRLAREVRKQMDAAAKRPRNESEEPPCPPAKLPRFDSPADDGSGGEGMVVTRSISPAASAAEVEDLMTMEPGSPMPGNTSETVLAAPTASAAPSNASRMGTPADVGLETDMQPGDSGVQDEELHEALGSSQGQDLPAASRSVSRAVSEHASGALDEASSAPTTTSLVSPPEATAHAQTPSLAVDLHRSKSAPSELDALRHDAVTHSSNTNLDDTAVAQSPHDEMQEQSVHVTEREHHVPPCLVPGLWQARRGRDTPGIETIEFFVDDATVEAAMCWGRRNASFSLDDRHVAVHLLCLPYSEVDVVSRNLAPDVSPGEIAQSLWKIHSQWPSKGELVVDINPCDLTEEYHGKAWLPIHLSSLENHMDITSSIQPGRNVIDIIQLDSLSDHLFVVHAAEPSEEERQFTKAHAMDWPHIANKLQFQSPRSSLRPKSIPAPTMMLV